MRAKRTVWTLLLVVSAVARAQSSASYHLGEHTENAGGRPTQGAIASSTSFHIRLDAIGDAVVAGASSTGFRMDGGFVSDYPPPGEVRGDIFSTKTQLVWNPERSVGTYDLYRGALSGLPSLDFGACLASGLAVTSATDATVPTAGQGYFYLVTARNRLREIGTKGYRSDGIERANATPCP